MCGDIRVSFWWRITTTYDCARHFHAEPEHVPFSGGRKKKHMHLQTNFYIQFDFAPRTNNVVSFALFRARTKKVVADLQKTFAICGLLHMTYAE